VCPRWGIWEMYITKTDKSEQKMTKRLLNEKK